MESASDYLWQFCCAPGFALSPLFWLPVAVLVLLFWVTLGRGQGLRQFLNIDGVLTHKSTRTDLWLFLISRVMMVFGIVTYFTFAPAVARFVADISPLPPLFAEGLSPLGLTLAVFVIFDFSQYWSHRIFHRSALWSLHAVHHSAEVLTPLTTYRVHPLAGVISAAFHSLVLGVGMGLIVGSLAPDMGFVEIAGTNAIVVLLNATVVNLHHSQIHISFGPIIERILISPAQHQIHHSRDPRHFNRNYGNVLAVWDWMFGTLYLVREKEELRFGLEGEAFAPLMTQRLWPMLIDPVRRLLS
ncbi:MAG: sterol desaturase family protein [Rhodobacteraceae bacterium]|nr:sterol desaturase family protein [Paracoccaceae bacterium]